MTDKSSNLNVYKMIASKLIEAGLAKPDEIKGCSDEEIKKLENHLNLRFPEFYFEFLQSMGKGAGKFLRGTDVFYSALPHLRQWAVDLLVEDNSLYTLPDDAFVFSMHQGYEFLFFILSEGNNPPIYQYVEGNKQPSKQWPSFSTFLKKCAEQHGISLEPG